MTNIINITQENFDSVVEQNSIVFLDFWAPWCGPCMSFAKIYEAVAARYSDITFGKINIDEQTKLAEEFQIRAIPQLMVIKDKVIVFSQSGVLPEKAVVDLIEQAKKVDVTSQK